MFYAKSDTPLDDEVLRALAADNPLEAVRRTSAVADLLARHVGQPAKVYPLARQGTFHIVHGATLSDGREIVVRSSLPQLHPVDDRMLIEASVFPLLETAGLTCPRLLLIAVGGERSAAFDAVVMDCAAGTAFADLDDQDDPGVLAAMGLALRRVHTIEGDGGYGPLAEFSGSRLRGGSARWDGYLDTSLDRHLATCRTLDLLTVAEAERARGLSSGADCGWRGDAGRLLHADPGGHNIFIDGGRVSALIDWEDAMLGDPLFDLAMWATFQPQRRHGAFLAGYGAPAASRDFARTFARYFLRITLAKAVHRIRFATPDLPGRPTLRQRLSEALELADAAD